MSGVLCKHLAYPRSVVLSIAVMSVLLLVQTIAMAADVTTLFQDAQTTASQLAKDAATMESYTRSNVNWQSHASQIAQIKQHLNEAGSILSQMHAARDDAQPWHQVAIDGITPALKELASNTESIINHLNENPKHLTDPAYVNYLQSNAQSAAELSAAVGNVVDYDKTKAKMEELETKLGR